MNIVNVSKYGRDFSIKVHLCIKIINARITSYELSDAFNN